MKRTQITIYTKFGKIEECNKIYAIKDEDVIKYIDLENNKMIIDMHNNTLLRENSDYIFNLDFNKEIIFIEMKMFKKMLQKSIKTLKLEKTKKSFLIRYQLLDEQEINEYYVKF